MKLPEIGDALLSHAGERLLRASMNRVTTGFDPHQKRPPSRAYATAEGPARPALDDAVGIPEQARKEELIMKKSLSLSALAFALMATPALARCHGHSTPDGHWDLNVNSWTREELLELCAIADKIKAIEPSSNVDGVEIGAVIDQYECAGVEHAHAVEDAIGAATALAALKRK